MSTGISPAVAKPQLKLRALIAGDLVIAAVASLWKLGNKNFDLDETLSVGIARLSSHDFWRVIRTMEANSSLYYLSLRGWSHVAHGQTLLRIPSALAAIAAVWFIFALGRRLFNDKVALIAGLLLGLNGFWLRYAQEARGYSFALCFITGATYFLIKAVQEARTRDWVGYVTFSLLALYSHFFSVLVIAAHIVGVVILPMFRGAKRSYAIAVAFIALGFAPLAFFIGTSDERQISWVPRSSLADLVRLLRLFSGEGGSILFAVFTLLGAFAIGKSYVDSRNAKPNHGLSLTFLIVWLSLPVVIAFLFSFGKPIFVNRYLIVALPAAVLIAAFGIGSIGSKPIMTFALVVTAALAAISEYRWYTGFPKEAWRDASTFVVSHDEMGDGIAFYPPSLTFPFNYYASGDERSTLMDSFYPPPSWNIAARDRTDLIDFDLAISRAKGAGYRRVWFIHRAPYRGYEDPSTKSFINRVLTDYRKSDSWSYPYVVIDLYTR